METLSPRGPLYISVNSVPSVVKSFSMLSVNVNKKNGMITIAKVRQGVEKMEIVSGYITVDKSGNISNKRKISLAYYLKAFKTRKECFYLIYAQPVILSLEGYA
jgi:hypothetical protein